MIQCIVFVGCQIIEIRIMSVKKYVITFTCIFHTQENYRYPMQESAIH